MPQHNPYRLRCSKCPKEFRNASGLTQHFNTQHAVQKTFFHPEHPPPHSCHPSGPTDAPETDTVSDFPLENIAPDVGKEELQVTEHPQINGELAALPSEAGML